MPQSQIFPYAGQEFTVNYGGELVFKNIYSEDGKYVTAEFLAGEMAGSRMTMPFEWEELPQGNFLLWWQEDDKSTIVHCDNFEQKKTKTFYTKIDGSFYVLNGEIS